MRKLTLALLGSVAMIGYRAGTPFPNTDVPLDTLTINTDAGPVRINATDYDPAVHTLAEGQEAPKQAPAPAAPVVTDPNAQTSTTTPTPSPAAPVVPPALGATTPPATDPAVTPLDQRHVTKNGNKFFVTNGEGKTLDADGKVAEGLEGFATSDDAKKSVNMTGVAPTEPGK